MTPVEQRDVSKAMFYTFDQNNSGGSWTCDPANGVSHYVIVEAENHVEANERAERIGLYFDGEGDCPCCGDRWGAAYNTDGTGVPMIYGKNVNEFVTDLLWLQDEKKQIAECYIHHHDGRIEPVMLKGK